MLHTPAHKQAVPVLDARHQAQATLEQARDLWLQALNSAAAEALPSHLFEELERVTSAMGQAINDCERQWQL